MSLPSALLAGLPAALAAACTVGAAHPALSGDRTHPHGQQQSGYAALEHRSLSALSAEEIEALLAGRGLSLALPAELNGYPGPLHVLELADELALTVAQQVQTRAVFDRMQSEAKALGARLVEAEAALEQLFRQGAARADSVHDAAARAAALRGELRGVHLRAHVEMKALLTPQQTQQYANLRGYLRP